MKNNIIAVIQARIGSSRLPGKILENIAGRPMLWHIVSRLKKSSMIDKIVVATSTDRKDDRVEDFCRVHAIDFFRGSEGDVLDRYYEAGKSYKADVVVRITGDCPLIDSQVTDKVIKAYLSYAGELTGASNTIKRTYPRGLDTEVISFRALERCWSQAREDYQREHVTIYIYEHPEKFKIFSVENNKNLSHLRWTVDEAEDLRFVREIYKRLYRDGEIFFMNDVLGVLEKEPHLIGINKDVGQKAVL